MGSTSGIANGFIGVANGFGVGVFGRLISLWFVTIEIKERRDKMKRSKRSIYNKVFSDENFLSPMPPFSSQNVSHFKLFSDEFNFHH